MKVSVFKLNKKRLIKVKEIDANQIEDFNKKYIGYIYIREDGKTWSNDQWTDKTAYEVIEGMYETLTDFDKYLAECRKTYKDDPRLN